MAHKDFFIKILCLLLFGGVTACSQDENSLEIASSARDENQTQSATLDELQILGLKELPQDIEGLNDPIPSYLTFVYPNPKSDVRQTEYDSYAISTGWDASKPGICLGYDPVEIFEEGEFPTQREVIDWISIRVDGISNLVIDGELAFDSSEITFYPTDEYGEVDFEGDPISIVPGGSPYRLCYAAPLGPGHHVVGLTVKNGDVLKGAYSWSFQIVE